MEEFLLIQLYGPLSSWGDVAVGEERPSQIHPTRSAVFGLLAAALGILRDDEGQHLTLQDGLGMAVRVDAPGLMINDYHTAQVPRSGKAFYTSRREELNADPKLIQTVLSTRQYRMDCLFTVGLWVNEGAITWSLQDLAHALEYPVFTPYLGRKSCPPSLPFKPQIVTAGTIFEAFDLARFPDLDFMDSISRPEVIDYFWEDGVEAGLEKVHTFQRRDALVSRRRWQFGERSEHHVGRRVER